jgi:hypothetical protein
MEEPDEEFVQMDTGASIMLVPIIKKKSKKGPTQSTLIKFINQIGKSTLQSFDFPIITKIVDKKIIEYVALKELYFLEGISKNTALKRLKTIDFIYPVVQQCLSVF